jgi:hypothetical protein
MANDTSRQSALFDNVLDKVAVAHFDQPDASSPSSQHNAVSA